MENIFMPHTYIGCSGIIFVNLTGRSIVYVSSFDPELPESVTHTVYFAGVSVTGSTLCDPLSV